MKKNLRVVEDCWQIYANRVVPADAPENVRDFIRAAFYAGVAFMCDTMLANCDEEDSGVAMLESVTAELDEFARGMAARKGLDLAEVRKAVAAELKRGRS